MRALFDPHRPAFSDRTRLSKTRRKRPIPDGWVTSEALNSFAPVEKSNPLYAGTRSFALNMRGEFALLGGEDGRLGVYSISDKAIVQEMDAGPGAVADALWIGDRAVASTSAGHVKIWENGAEVASFYGHAGEATALAVHPSGDILASVGIDKSYIFYDLTTNSIATQVLTDAGKTENTLYFFRVLTVCSTYNCWIPSGRPFVRCWRHRRPNQGIRRQDHHERRELRLCRAYNSNLLLRKRHMAHNGRQRIYPCVYLGSAQSCHCPHDRYRKSHISRAMGV